MRGGVRRIRGDIGHIGARAVEPRARFAHVGAIVQEFHNGRSRVAGATGWTWFHVLSQWRVTETNEQSYKNGSKRRAH